MAPVLDVWEGDITEEWNDLIVNPANKSLEFGGQVSQALLKKCPSLRTESKKQGAKMQRDGYNIVQYQIPGRGRPILCMNIDSSKPSKQKILDILNACVDDLEENEVGSISLPSIGAGTSGLSHDDSSNIVLNSLMDWVEHQGDRLDFLDMIKVVIYQNRELYEKYLAKSKGEGASSHAGPPPRDAADVRDIQWVDVDQDDPLYRQVQDNSRGVDRAIRRVQRPAQAEDLARQTLARLSVADSSTAAAAAPQRGSIRQRMAALEHINGCRGSIAVLLLERKRNKHQYRSTDKPGFSLSSSPWHPKEDSAGNR